MKPARESLNLRGIFLRAKTRKHGKLHHCWSIGESRRARSGRVVQRHLRYLGEINHAQRVAGCHSTEVPEGGRPHPSKVGLFPEERRAPELSCEVVQVRLSELSLHRARQWSAR